MSTDLRNVPNTNMSQTRFWGGVREQCVQITRPASQRTPGSPLFDAIQLTREEAGKLAVELTLFSQGQEVIENE
ncbi:hypothetical protein N9V27_00920 [bacterium]|nr:hypothetical protein [bacterium]